MLKPNYNNIETAMRSSIKHVLAHVALCAGTLLGATGANATVLTFDDVLPPAVNLGSLTTYEGFSWSDGTGGEFADIQVVNVPAFGASLQPGFIQGLVSGSFVAAKAAGSSADGALPRSRILGSEGFMPDSAYFTAGSGNQTLTFEGYKTGTSAPVYSAVQEINSTAKTLVTFSGWLDIDELRITTSVPSISWVMDDFAFSAPVPEASSWAMLAAGLGLLAFAVRGSTAAR